MKQIRCEISREELDRALAFSGVMTVGEGANMRIARVPESVREPPSAEEIKNLENSRNWASQGEPTLEQQLAEAEAKLARLESKVCALEGDVVWLVDAMRRIGEKLR